MDRIRIEGLEIECIVGIRALERRRRQPVRIDLALGLDLSAAGQSGRIAETIDYSHVADAVTALMRFREYRLIEMATEELCAMLFGLYPMLERVQACLHKPGALPGRAKNVSVQVERSRSRFPRRRRSAAYGLQELLLQTEEAAMYLAHVECGRSFAPELSPNQRCMERLVTGTLSCNGTAMRVGDSAIRDGEHRNPYHNRGPERASLFCCSCREDPDRPPGSSR